MTNLSARRAVALLVCAAALAACSRTMRVPEPVEHATYVEELRSARSADLCASDVAATLDSSWAEFPIRSEVKGVRLNSQFLPAKPEPDAIRTTWAWRGADSTMVTLMLTPTPPGAVGGFDPVVGDGGLYLRLPEGADTHSDARCRLGSEGGDVLLSRWVSSHPADPDTVYGMSATMFVRHGLVVNMVGLTPNRAMRDSLVGSLLTARFETNVASR